MPCAGHGYSTGGAGSHHRSRLRGRPRGNGKRAIKGGDAVLPSGNWSIKATVFIAPAIVIVLMLATVVVFDQALRQQQVAFLNVVHGPLARSTTTTTKLLVAVSEEIGRASCRERVCQYVSISVVAVSLHKKNTDN